MGIVLKPMDEDYLKEKEIHPKLFSVINFTRATNYPDFKLPEERGKIVQTWFHPLTNSAIFLVLKDEKASVVITRIYRLRGDYNNYCIMFSRVNSRYKRDNIQEKTVAKTKTAAIKYVEEELLTSLPFISHFVPTKLESGFNSTDLYKGYVGSDAFKKYENLRQATFANPDIKIKKIYPKKKSTPEVEANPKSVEEKTAEPEEVNNA